MLKNVKVLGLAVVLMLALTLAACGNNNNNNADNANNANDANNNASDMDLGEKDLTVPYVAWAGAIARTELLTQVLESVGYNVTETQVDAGPMWSSVASGDADFMAAAWLPTTHQSYWDKYKDDVDDINQVIDKAPLALTVPSYMKDVNSIEDLKDNKKLGESIDWEIVGIDPGAGIMQNTQKALKEYGLDKWKLTPSSEGAMISVLQKKMKKKEPVVVPLWKPHWAFSQMDLKMLKDPKGIYGGDGDHIDIVVSKDLEKKAPAAYKILKSFTSNYDILNALMGPIHDGDKPEDVVKKYLDENPDQLAEWTKAAK